LTGWSARSGRGHDAAAALEPVAGPPAFVLFALGLIGTGLLAVPILSGAAATGVLSRILTPAAFAVMGLGALEVGYVTVLYR